MSNTNTTTTTNTNTTTTTNNSTNDSSDLSTSDYVWISVGAVVFVVVVVAIIVISWIYCRKRAKARMNGVRQIQQPDPLHSSGENIQDNQVCA